MAHALVQGRGRWARERWASGSDCVHEELEELDRVYENLAEAACWKKQNLEEPLLYWLQWFAPQKPLV